jgi:hypothetical protein
MDEGRITLDDKFFRELLHMSDLRWAPSWVEGMTDKQITALRRKGYFQFFAISYLYHPARVFKTAFNILRGIEENKVERVGHEKLQSAKKLLLRALGLKKNAAVEGLPPGSPELAQHTT